MVTNVGCHGPDTGLLPPVHRMTLSLNNEKAPVIVYQYRIPVSGYHYGHQSVTCFEDYNSRNQVGVPVSYSSFEKDMTKADQMGKKLAGAGIQRNRHKNYPKTRNFAKLQRFY